MAKKSVFLMALFAFVFVSLSASAQPDRRMNRMNMSPEEVVTQQMASLTELLTLNTEQQTAIRAVLEGNTKEAMAMRAKIRDASPEDRRSMIESFRKTQEESDKAIMALLDNTQKEKYTKHLEERANRRRGRIG